MAYVAPGASVWAVATRLTPLDSLGNLLPGSNSFVTDQLVKATMTPVYESGDAVAVKNASGELSVYAVHGDIPKWFTANIELALPDPNLEAVLTGGIVYSDAGVALGAPTGTAVATETTGGTLTAGSYGYRVAQFNAYGSTIPGTEVVVVTTGSTSKNVISGTTLSAGGLGWRLYGRSIGGEQYMSQMIGIGTQATSAASGTGAVASLSVTSLTKPIPSGYTFQITGDTNTPKITFTTTIAAPVGAVSLQVTADTTVTTTIAAAALIPVFVDTGALVPSGLFNTTDKTTGPGTGVGYQLGAMGTVQNPNGVAVEFFQRRIINGVQATDYPYWRHVWPMVKNLHVMPRDFTNANLANIYEGEAFQNPNFGSGPDGTWQFDSTKVYQRAMCGAEIVPTTSVTPVAALY